MNLVNYFKIGRGNIDRMLSKWSWNMLTPRVHCSLFANIGVQTNVEYTLRIWYGKRK